MSIQALSAELSYKNVKHMVVIAVSEADVKEFKAYLDIAPKLNLITPNDSVLRKIIAVNPSLRARDYAEMAVQAKRVARVLDVANSTIFDVAFKKKYGREAQPGDFKISGVGDDSLPEETKDKLRYYAHTAARLSKLGVVFARISKKRSLK